MTKRFLPTESAARKQFPMCTGLLDYFPDALAAVAGVSWIGNEKHNPGEALHWARGKSTDHPDCIARHLTERGGFEEIKVGDKVLKVRHSAALAWRALANLQEELEAEYGLSAPRGTRGEAAPCESKQVGVLNGAAINKCEKCHAEWIEGDMAPCHRTARAKL